MRRILPILIVLAQVTASAQLIIIRPPVLLPPQPGGGGGGTPGDYADRLINWTPGTYTGVVGGIPTTRTQCVTSACQDVTNAATGYKDGTLDAKALLQAAVSSAPADTYVLMPAGTWKILSTLEIQQSDDSVTLRGSGVGTTTIDCRASVCIAGGSESDYSWGWPASDNLVTAYGTSGSNSVLTIADTSNFSVGQLVRWTVVNDTNDPEVPIVSTAGYGSTAATLGQAARRQMVRVVSKTGTTLTVFPPIFNQADYAGLTARVNVAQFQSDNIGVEDLTVDCTNGTVFAGIKYEQTYSSWVKNVRVYNASNYHIYLVDSLMPEVRRSTLEVRLGGGTNGGNLLVNTVSSALIEDNIIREGFPAIEVNFGSTGNVFAFNFIHNENGADTINGNHGPQNQYNLYEGNITTIFKSDGLFGGSSYDTLFRNIIHGNYIDVTDTQSYCITLKRFTRKTTLVGNLFGGPLSSSSCEPVYGQPNLGNGDSTGTAQPSLGDWWIDLNSDGTTPITGQLTTRTDDQHGQITLTTGTLEQVASGACIQELEAYVRLTNGADVGYFRVTSQVGGVATVDSSVFQSAVLPANGTNVHIWAGYCGFQELDLDVEATAIVQDNYEAFADAIDLVSGDTLPNSLFRSAKPSWFNSLTWPAVNSSSPTFDYEIIPAGYRYMNAGSDPP